MRTPVIRRFAVLAAFVTGALLTQIARADDTDWKLDLGNHTPGVGGGGFNFHNGPVIGVWDSSADFGDLIFKATFEGATWDNTANMNGNFVYPWGNGSGTTATYGQTFIAPDAGKLLDFTFYISGIPGTDILYQAFVMTWGAGPLVGGGNKSGSTIIYASNPLSYLGDGTYKTVTSSIGGGGGLALESGQAYLFGLTTVGTDVVVPTGPSTPPGVPDAGSSAALLLVGLGALGAIRRRNSRV